MEGNLRNETTYEYCYRFGKIAVDMGLITIKQLKVAITEQIEEDIANMPHKLIGEILFEKGWLTYQQVELVLKELLKNEK